VSGQHGKDRDCHCSDIDPAHENLQGREQDTSVARIGIAVRTLATASARRATVPAHRRPRTAAAFFLLRVLATPGSAESHATAALSWIESSALLQPDDGVTRR